LTSAGARPAFRPQAVVFDCDGLLLETESRWTIAEAALFEAHGGTFTPALKEQLLGTSREVSQAMIAEALGRPQSDAEALGDELAAGFGAAMAEHGAEPMPGVIALLDALRGVVPLAVASNNAEPIVRESLAALGLADRFSAVLCAGGPYAGKPAPDLYLAAAAALGADPVLTVALEDSVTGAAAAHAAGCFTIGVPTFPGTRMPAHAVYASLAEVGPAELGFA
jgi:HAD superfamily hydrolase (TIGR01509 family)